MRIRFWRRWTDPEGWVIDDAVDLIPLMIIRDMCEKMLPILEQEMENTLAAIGDRINVLQLEEQQSELKLRSDKEEIN